MVIIYNLFINLTMRDAIIAVAIVVILFALSFIRLKQGAVKPEKLEEVRQKTIQDALLTTNAAE